MADPQAVRCGFYNSECDGCLNISPECGWCSASAECYNARYDRAPHLCGSTYRHEGQCPSSMSHAVVWPIVAAVVVVLVIVCICIKKKRKKRDPAAQPFLSGPPALSVLQQRINTGAPFSIQLRSVLSNSYLSAFHTGAMQCQSVPQPFMLEPAIAAPGAYCLRAAHGTFVCAEPTGICVANRPTAQQWEHFELLPIGDLVALRSRAHGTLLTVNSDGSVLFASSPPSPLRAQLFHAQVVS
ncbi:MAG: hypothetical protein MHM6MM_004836 [Cercozoa sp. M6MM]